MATYNYGFLPSNNWPGSSGYSTMSEFPSIYPTMWDPVNRRTVSNDPNRPGYTPFGQLNTPPNPYYNPAYATTPTWGIATGANSPYTTTGGGGGAGGAAAGPYGAAGGTSPNQSQPTAGSKQLLGGAAGGSSGGGSNTNPFFTLSNVKSPAIDTEIQKMLGDLDTLRTQNPTADVTAKVKAAQPNLDQYLGQETSAIGDVFGTGLQSQLEAIRQQRATAYNTAADRALGNLQRVLSLKQMGQGGAGTVGLSGYLSKQALDTAADLAAKSGLDQAEQARQDLAYLQQQRMGLLGSRAGLTQQNIQASLLPSQVAAQWYQTMMGGLTPLAQLQLANTFYGLGKQRGDLTIDSMGNYGAVPTYGTQGQMPILPNYGAQQRNISGGGMPINPYQYSNAYQNGAMWAYQNQNMNPYGRTGANPYTPPGQAPAPAPAAPIYNPPPGYIPTTTPGVYQPPLAPSRYGPGNYWETPPEGYYDTPINAGPASGNYYDMPDLYGI